MLSSKRLQKITEMVSGRYQHIWDCCCDHGLLGLELLHSSSATVHFVDCQPHLISSLETVLRQRPELGDRWRLHCQRVQQLRLTEAGQHLIIIAGVGGETCIEMLETLLNRYPDMPLDFIFCPVRQVEQLRASLARHDMGLLQESLIEEKRRFYEVLYLRRFKRPAISAVLGVLLDNGVYQRYVDTRIRYLSQSSNGGCDSGTTALKAYKNMLE